MEFVEVGTKIILGLENKIMFRKLYSLNKDRKSFSVWTIEVIENKIITSFGKLNGKMQTKEEVILEGKNIGRSNSTTPSQQAINEAQSTLNKKWDGMYRETMEEAERAYYENLKPQLAHSYTEESNQKKIVWPAYISPKLDGARIFVEYKNGVVKYLSRERKEFPINKELYDQIELLIKEMNVPFLDGELYLHDYTFQELISCVKKPIGNKLENIIEFHVFDIPSEKTYDESIHTDFIELERIINKNNLNRIKIVDAYLLENFESAKELMSRFLLFNYEGMVIRNATHVYEFSTRSVGLQKYKLFFDEEYVLKDILEDRVGNCVFLLESEHGEFKATPKYSHDERKEFLNKKEKLIGKLVTVKYQEKTDSGLPRFPIAINIDRGAYE